MKISKLLLALGASALLSAGTNAIAQDDEDGYILEVTQVGVKIGHEMKFRKAVKAYHECLLENDYQGSWSTWTNVGGEGRDFHFVSTMDNWAEMDSPNQAARTCWSEHHDSLTAHVNSASTIFARPMADWSGDDEGYSVVRLHKFRVDDNKEFRDVVGEITGILKEAEYEHLGSWYRMIGSDANDPDYFVVSHYQNFAALDQDRGGPYKTLVEAEGQERADELWERFEDSLRDDDEYSTDLLRRVDELSHSNDE